MSEPTLTEFLLARIAEDEGVAKAATPGPWYWQPESGEDWPSGDQSLCTRHRNDGETFDPTVLYGWGYDASGIEAEQGDRDHIARHDPTRVLAECEAKRRILEYGQRAAMEQHEAFMHYGTAIADSMRALAAVYADHPDYRDEWKP